MKTIQTGKKRKLSRKEEERCNLYVESKESDKHKEESEREKYWKLVKENPSDFTGWTYLLQFVEQESDLSSAREAFQSFFKYYPYCYGYWKKYADMEKKFDSLEGAEKVFEEGVAAVSLSVDLWIHYINFCKTKYKDAEDSYSKIKEICERAALAAGYEFRSDRFWDLYISWEEENKNLKEVTAIYDRLLTIPTQLYSHHFEKFQQHVKKTFPKEILSTDEFIALRQEFLSNRKREENVFEEKEKDEEEGVGDDEAPPGVESEDAPPGLESPEKVEKNKMNDEETEFLRRRIIEKRRVIFEANEIEVSKRWAFEEGIKRPYFHVKPLERTQLKNWRDYLDFEIENGSHERTVILFERCMIACALYEDMWMKYAKYMEDHSLEAVRNVYKRACEVHLPRKPNINFLWAAHEEKQGNYEEAENILKALENNVPDMLETTIRRINVARRKGDSQKVELLYETCISQAKNIRTSSHFASKFARYLYKVKRDSLKAVQVLKEALLKDPTNPHLHMQLIDVGYQNDPIDMNAIMETFDMALNSEMEAEQKVVFSQRKLEFLEDFGSDPLRIQEAFEDYTKLLKNHYTMSKKRPGEEMDENSREKKYKTEVNGSDPSSAAAAAQLTAAQLSAAQISAAQLTAASLSGSSLTTASLTPVAASASISGTQDTSTYPYQQVQQSWVGYPQVQNYNYQQGWNSYGASYYPSH